MGEGSSSKWFVDVQETENGTMPKAVPPKPRPSRIPIGAFTNDALRHKTTSLMWEDEHDPFQVFEVGHESCWDLEIEVQRGENVTKGSAYQDFCDTPDPYVVLRVPGSSNPSRRTSHMDNSVNPIWNETFHFYLDPSKQYKLHITLMDANLILSDEILGEQITNVNSLPFDVSKDYTADFLGGSKVHLKLILKKKCVPDLRFSLALCEEEKEFLRKRRLEVMTSMQKLLGVRGPKYKNEVPVVAILGSGGGFRAMTCLSGVMKALHESGIFECCTYIAGLSGSSWLISTLFAHDKFPDITYDDVYDSFLSSVTYNWKWNLMHSHRYILEMVKKYRGGQPISFTDIFGHLLGDVLLKGQTHKKLSDQRQVISTAEVPMPLYTCLHAKASVSCREFSEWIEFSPYEIGIAKYGTFMKSEHFGSKFIMGKLIKTFPEFPLHYLQGIWGSAFTVLMKRLVVDGKSMPKEDLVQIIREANEEREMHEKLEQRCLNEGDEAHKEQDSETDDDEDVHGADDSGTSEEEERLSEIEKRLLAVKGRELPVSKKQGNTKVNESNKIEEIKYEENGRTEEEIQKKSLKFYQKRFSFELTKTAGLKIKRRFSKDETNPKKWSSNSDPGIIDSSYIPKKTNIEVRKARMNRQGAIKEHVKTGNYWKERRQLRRTKRENNSSLLQEMMTNLNILSSRAGRAGEILNPFRGLSLKETFPVSPFTTADVQEAEDGGDDFGYGCRYEALDNKAKKLFVVDSGLAFNSPYPILLRPQRAVNIYLSFDFSQRPSDRHMPFKELLLAEKWAMQNNVQFPPIEKQVEEYSKEKIVKELYIFKNKDDPTCPVILHFVIVNNRFRIEKAPGVVRQTVDEFDFAHFSLFDEPSKPFASTNFVYSSLQYERLVKLMEYNVLLCIDTIKEEIAMMIEIKRKLALSSLDQTFKRMHNVVSAFKQFKKSHERLRLRVCEDKGKEFVNAWRQTLIKRQVGRSYSDSDINDC